MIGGVLFAASVIAEMTTIAHVSDLHFGGGVTREAGAHRLATMLHESDVDVVVVTGDVTHRGDQREYDRFRATYSPLSEAGRMLVVPGNHDRLGADLADEITGGERVRTCAIANAWIVLVDSTGVHNRFSFAAHGRLDARDLADIDAALSLAPEGATVVVAMHHHAIPLPTETALEHLSTLLGLPYAAELATGAQMLEVLAGRCDVLLHGHRHVPRAMTIPGARPLAVYNAGCSSDLERVRVLTPAAGAVASERWLCARSYGSSVGSGSTVDTERRGSTRRSTPSRPAASATTIAPPGPPPVVHPQPSPPPS
jgi:3',5'-cyclic AMP phosphodiesterase CpdA